jgi:sodium transport system permease protein
MNKIGIIFVKEVLDSMRDYRSWSTGLFWAVFGPLMMGGMFMLIGSSLREDIEKPLNLPVQNPENAPNLVRFLEQHDVIIEPAPADPEAAVKAGDVNIVLVVSEEYGEDFSSGKSATVRLVIDSSRQSAQVDVSRIQGLLDGYSSYLGGLRLVVRGIFGSNPGGGGGASGRGNAAKPGDLPDFVSSIFHYFRHFQRGCADHHGHDRRRA